jgi:hypothetical protein
VNGDRGPDAGGDVGGIAIGSRSAAGRLVGRSDRPIRRSPSALRSDGIG